MNTIEQTLTESEQRRLVELSEEASRNKAKAQQLALDAGKLLTATSGRLEEYKNRGFFKRCWYAICGKQGELDRANQSDLIAMQKFAYAYLMKLQEQNLVEAQAIAVIRNNLKELQEETGEIYDMISTIVKKFDARITRLENVTALHDWVIRISAHEEEFAKDKLAICFLQLVFDYLNVMRDGHIPFESVENRDELALALKRFGIDANAECSVEEFVSKLFSEIETFGYTRFADIVNLKVAGNVVEPLFILDNVTGAGYNAIYHLVQKMAGMVDMAAYLSDRSAARTAMLEAVISTLNNRATKYTVLELAMEILGGSLIAEEVYVEEKGIALGVSERPQEIQPFDIGELFGDYMTISSHPFIATNPSDDDKQRYLEAFALVYATVGYNANSSYLKAIANLFSHEESLNRVEWLSEHPAQIKPMIPEMIKMLSSDARKFAWCVDAIYLGYEKSGSDPTGRLKNGIAQICKFLKIKDDVAKRLLDGAEKLAVAQTAKEFADASQSLHDLTDAWKTVLEIKGLSLKGAFTAQRDALTMLVKESESSELTSAELFLSKLTEAAISKCDAFMAEIKKVMLEVRPILSMFNTNVSECDTILSQGIPRQPSSATIYLTKVRLVLTALLSQLEMYEDGNFSGNVLTFDQGQNGIAREVEISDSGVSRKLSFEFMKLERTPFDHSNVLAVDFLEGEWYVLTKENGVWCSGDGEAWQNINLPSSFSSWGLNMHVAGDMLTVWNNSEIVVRGHRDGEWIKVNLPWSSWDKDIVFIYKVKDGWILQASERTEYTYTSKGVIWDSKETSNYKAAAFYKCTDLAENTTWEKIENFSTKDGFGILPGCACFVEDGMVALANKDSMYCLLRNIGDSGSHFLYALKGNELKKADCLSDVLQIKDRFGRNCSYPDMNARMMNYDGHLLCCCAAGILSSKDGRVWSLIEKRDITYSNHEMNVDIHRLGDIVIASVAYDNLLSCSLDGETFTQIPIESFPSFIACGNDSILIVDTADNTGGMFLGKIKCE